MPGRPPKPIAVKMAEGKTHMTKEEIKKQLETEIVAPSDKVKAPKYLGKRLSTRFDELASDLVDLNILSNLDVDTLARYVVAEDKHQEIIKKMKKKMLTDDLDTYDKLSKIQDRYAKQARTAANDLGLTITSRLKLVVPPKPEKKIKTMEDFLFENQLGGKD